MQSYFGGRSECRIRHEVVPVVPVDFTSEYPSCCANLGLFKTLTAEQLHFVDDTENIKRFLAGITQEKCFNREMWRELNFVARVMPDGDILPVRTVYNGVSQNIGNNFLEFEAGRQCRIFLEVAESYMHLGQTSFGQPGSEQLRGDGEGDTADSSQLGGGAI